MKQLMNVNTRLVANANDPISTEKKKNVLLPLESSEGAEIMKTWGQIFNQIWTQGKGFRAALWMWAFIRRFRGCSQIRLSMTKVLHADKGA